MKSIMELFTMLHVFFYRLSGGVIGGQMGPGHILLIDSVGRKTGKPRTNPVMYIRDGDRYVVAASAGGGPSNPGWYYNLRAVSHTIIQVKDQKIPVSVEEAEPGKREILWAQLVTEQPQFKNYETRTTRKIPMFIFKPL
jgi:F420H(2)-dependent quinone reductase